jgi:uncharacterized protein GlcG (DUF336 family)
MPKRALTFATLALAAALAALAAPANAQGLIAVKEISVDMADAMVRAALELCRKDKYRVAIAVVDRGGHLLAFLREDMTPPHATDLAIRKAYTSRVFRQTSREFSQRLRDNPISAGLGTTAGVIASIGGLPIKAGDEVIGGIGVSGAPGGEKDEACAQAGIAKVADRLK